MKSFKNFISESVLNPKDPHGDYKAKKKVLLDLGKNKDVDQAHVQQRNLDLDKEYAKYKVQEDGMGSGAVSSGSKGPTNVTGPQSGTDPISATARRMDKKRKYLMGIRRNPPKM